MTKYERLYTADEVDGMIARAKAAAAQPEEPVAKHHDLHSHMMVVAHRAVDEASNNGRESISQKEVVRAICKAIQSNKNLLAKLTPLAAQQIDEAYAVGYSNGMTEGYEAGKACAAAQRTWVGLTDERVKEIWLRGKDHGDDWLDVLALARSFEAELKELNT